MKKFTFLLALIAVFAMSAAAFASAGDIASLFTNGKVSNQINGAISNDKSLVVSGDYATKAYYIGEKVTGKIALGVELSAAYASYSDETLKAQQNGETSFLKIVNLDATSTKFEDGSTSFEIPSTGITKTTNYMIGVHKTDAWVPSLAHKSLDVIPTKVGFDSAITVKPLKGSAGSADISADFAEKNPGIVLYTLGDFSLDQYLISYDAAGAAKSLPNDGKAAVIGGLSIAYDADSFTLTVSNDQATPAKGGTKVELEIVAAADNLFNIIEGDISITVAGVQDAVSTPVVVGKITIDVEESAVDQLVDQLIDEISKDADLADGVNIVDADGKVVPESDIITISEDYDIVLNIISLDKATLTPFPITSADADKVVIAQGARHRSPEASVKPIVRIDGGYILSVKVTPSNIEELKKKVATSSVRAAAVVVEDYDFHLDALGKTLGLVYQTAEEVPGSSSGGACDMGFGLVAIAGLAALALRKRSK